MVVSLVLGVMAMFVATMGMKCTRCGGDDKVKKARIAMTGGIVFIVAGESRAHGSLRAGERGRTWCCWEGSPDIHILLVSRSGCFGRLLLVRP